MLSPLSFSTKEAATHAIVAVNNTEINQQPVKCAWGKESGDPNHMSAIAGGALAQGFPFGSAAAAAAAAAYGQQVAGYWYPPAPTYPAAAPPVPFSPDSSCRACRDSPTVNSPATSRRDTWGEFEIQIGAAKLCLSCSK